MVSRSGQATKALRCTTSDMFVPIHLPFRPPRTWTCFDHSLVISYVIAPFRCSRPLPYWRKSDFGMLIISWNVAGLSTTLDRINASYNPATNTTTSVDGNDKNPAGKKRKRSPTDAFLCFMNRHQVDVLCVQEHKIPISQLSTRKEPFLCSTVDGFESFWSCCVDKKQRGMNGVVTVSS